MKSSLSTISAALLIVVFGLFNIGIPVVQYLCPMMQSSTSECTTLCETESADLALVNQNNPCCNSYIVAERNTTPFVKSDKNNFSATPAIVPLPVEASKTDIATVANVSIENSRAASPPIFLLNSAFLI